MQKQKVFICIFATYSNSARYVIIFILLFYFRFRQGYQAFRLVYHEQRDIQHVPVKSEIL